MSAPARIALLDWDWTLRDGFTASPWLRALARDAQELAAADRFDAALAAYLAGSLAYDRLALLAEEVYVGIAAGRPVAELAERAEAVAATDRLRPGAEALLAALRSAGIRPVVISGAPVEVLRAHARRLGIDPADVTGWELARDGDRIAPRLASGNTARAEAKAVVVARVAAGAEVVLGIGDSDGDRPLVAAARIGAWVDPRTADEARRVRWTDGRDGSTGTGSLADLARVPAAA
ncbi:MAG: HAD family hydrolase [Chloroflexota bacterium]